MSDEKIVNVVEMVSKAYNELEELRKELHKLEGELNAIVLKINNVQHELFKVTDELTN